MFGKTDISVWRTGAKDINNCLKTSLCVSLKLLHITVYLHELSMIEARTQMEKKPNIFINILNAH